MLIHGDCLEEMAKLPPNSVDLVLTDPPYGTTKNKWDTVIPFELMWCQLSRLCTKMVALFGNEPFSSLLRVSRIREYKYDWVWNKSPASGHLNAKKIPMSDIENIMVFSQNGSFYYPIMEKGKPYTVKSGRGSNNYGSQVPVTTNNNGDRYPRRVLLYKKDKEKYTPTQKPVALLEYLIKTYTQPGETVLDFTMGSGSTGVACKSTGRNFIGIERDSKYFEIAQNRIQEVLG